MFDPQSVRHILKLAAGSGAAVLLVDILLELKKLIPRRSTAKSPEKPKFLNPKQFIIRLLRHLSFAFGQLAALNLIRRYSHPKLIFPFTFVTSLVLTELCSVEFPLAIAFYVTTRVMVRL